MYQGSAPLIGHQYAVCVCALLCVSRGIIFAYVVLSDPGICVCGMCHLAVRRQYVGCTLGVASVHSGMQDLYVALRFVCVYALGVRKASFVSVSTVSVTLGVNFASVWSISLDFWRYMWYAGGSGSCWYVVCAFSACAAGVARMWGFVCVHVGIFVVWLCLVCGILPGP